MAHYLGELTESNMKNLQALIDSNSVIGREIVTPDGTVILPVSKSPSALAAAAAICPPAKRSSLAAAPAAGSPSRPWRSLS